MACCSKDSVLPADGTKKRKRNEACDYVRTSEAMIFSMKSFMKHENEQQDIEDKPHPFNIKRLKVQTSLAQGKMETNELLIGHKIDKSDKSFKEYVDKPLAFDTENWYSTDVENIRDFEEIVSEINRCIPSVIKIGNKILNITTSQAILSYSMATPCSQDINYTLSIKPEFFKDTSFSGGSSDNVSNKRTDFVVDMCKTRVGIKKDKFKKIHVLSAGTGCGKTMMATISSGLCIIDKSRWKFLRMAFSSHQFEHKFSGAICNSHHEDPVLVRCCLIFSPKNLTSQWSDSVIGVCKSLIFHLQNYSSKVYVWTGRGDVYKIFMAKDLSRVHSIKLDSTFEDYPKKGNFNMKWFYENIQSKIKNSCLFWILPLCSDSISEIQSYPYLNYSCQIFDEYTNSTKKNNQFTRSVCFGPTIVTQATLEGLSECMGRDPYHPLRIAMNSSSINRVSNLNHGCGDIIKKCFQSSTRTSVNYEVSSLIHDMQTHSFQSLFITPYFLRRFLSFESKSMMMKGTDIYHIIFKNVTMESRLGLVESDMFSSKPDDFSKSLVRGAFSFTYDQYRSNVLFHKANSNYKFSPYKGIGKGNAEDYELTDVEYVLSITSAKKDLEVLCNEYLYKDIDKFCREGRLWLKNTEFLFSNVGKFSLVVNKMTEMFIGEEEKTIIECPVCFREKIPLKEIKMTSCCICTLCESCFKMCKICPNCRDPRGIKENIDGSCFEAEKGKEEDTKVDKGKSPEVECVSIPSNTYDAIKTLCYSNVNNKLTPMNLYNCFEGAMKVLLNNPKPRIIIYANYTSGMDFHGLNNIFSNMFDANGGSAKVYDMEKMSGNIKKSTQALEDFHSKDKSPVVWICSSTGSSQTFAGLDLYDLSGMIVCNTHMSNHMLDQIIGRMTRMTTDETLKNKRVPIIHLIGS